MKEFWNKRYQTSDYIYGTEPNQFFKQVIKGRKPGGILLPGEGEGRNAIYAAGKGWSVDALDQSEVARNKALHLARMMDVFVRYYVVELEQYNFPKEHYDAVGMIFLHLNPTLRQVVHRKLVQSLKPGGLIFGEFYTKRQIEYQTGGPKDPDMLYSSEILKEDLVGVKFEMMDELVLDLKEGSGHQGESAVLRMVGVKR